jgi:aspartate kinase
MIKVVKFGGSSLASAEQFKKVGNIIRADEDRKYVVPSAPGKRFPEDTKVTDMLYKCYAEAEAGKNIEKSLKAIEERYNEIIKGLGLKLSLKEQFSYISALSALATIDPVTSEPPLENVLTFPFGIAP